MGAALFAAIAMLAIAFSMVKRRAFVLLVIAMSGIPISLMTGDSQFFGALGGMAGSAVWLFAIVVGCLAAMIGSLGHLHRVLARTPAFLLFLLFAAVSLSWAESFLDGVRMMAKYAAPIVFFWVLLAMNPDARLIRRAESALYFSCIAAAAMAFANTLGNGVLAPVPLKHGILGLAALATPYSSPANFSFFMLCGAIVAYCRFLESRRVVHAALTVFLFLCVALAFVRITLGAAVLGLAVIHLVRARAMATPLFVSISLLAGTLIVTSDAFMERMFFIPERVNWSQAITAPQKFMENVNTSGRTLLWARATKAFAGESAWIGAGAGAVDAWINTGDSFQSELHSEVFRVRLELGWLGLGIFLAGLGSLWWQLLRNARAAMRPSMAMRASCALVPVYFLTLLTDNTFNYAAGFGVLVHGFAAMALIEAAALRKTSKAPTRAASPILHGSVLQADKFDHTNQGVITCCSASSGQRD